MNTTSFDAMDAWFFNRNGKYAEFYYDRYDMMVKENRDTKKYKHIVLGFDVSADFREINRILTKNKRWLQFIKSSPIFFMDQDDEIIKCDELGEDLKLWLMSCEQEYYVFLNCGIRRYDNYLANLKAEDSVKYDISYPIFERFENEKDALAFYEKIEALLDVVRMKESICQKFSAIYISEIRNDYSYNRKIDFFEKTIYYFNNSQKLSIFLQKMDKSEFVTSTYSIFVNRKIEICFDNEKNRDACWEYLINFYEKFEEKKIKGMSTQLFLTDFLLELMQNSEEVEEFKKEEGKVSWLRCKFKGYSIFFRLISRNGRYWEKYFEFKIFHYEKSILIKRSNIQAFKSMMKELFYEEEFMEKYFSC